MTAVPQKTIILKLVVALISRSKFILPYALRVQFLTKQALLQTNISSCQNLTS